MCQTKSCVGYILALLLFYFIGNFDFGVHKNKHMFVEHMLDKQMFRYNKKTVKGLEDIETFFSKIVIKFIII